MRYQDLWFNRIPRDSRYNDRMRGRTIREDIHYITGSDLLGFQNKQQNRCYYCDNQMKWYGDRRSDKTGLTLERKNNDLAHYTMNCLGLCCKSCNSKKYSGDRAVLKRWFSKWKNYTFEIHSGGDFEERMPSMA